MWRAKYPNKTHLVLVSRHAILGDDATRVKPLLGLLVTLRALLRQMQNDAVNELPWRARTRFSKLRVLRLREIAVRLSPEGDALVVKLVQGPKMRLAVHKVPRRRGRVGAEQAENIGPCVKSMRLFL